MSEHDLFESVKLLRGRLADLCASLEEQSAARGSLEMVGAVRDLQEMFDKLQSRYGLMRKILDRTNDIVFAKHQDGRYAMINEQGAALLGKSMQNVVGADDRDLFGPATAERIVAIDRSVMNTGVPQTHEENFGFGAEAKTLRTTTTAWYDDERAVRGVIGIAQDVTERRRSESAADTHRDRMRSMATEILLGEERLRQSLAAELHKGLGQDIALAKLKLSLLRGSAGVELNDPLSSIEELVERADKSLRSITFQISPPSLHDLGLVPALQWLGEDIGRTHGIDVHVDDDGSPSLFDERIRVILFRAVRELLLNAANHADVNEVLTTVARDDGHVRITVQDAGCGFDTDDLDGRGYGLFGISEQLKSVHGTLDIESAPGRGTTITLSAPLTEPGTVATS